MCTSTFVGAVRTANFLRIGRQSLCAARYDTAQSVFPAHAIRRPHYCHAGSLTVSRTVRRAKALSCSDVDARNALRGPLVKADSPYEKDGFHAW